MTTMATISDGGYDPNLSTSEGSRKKRGLFTQFRFDW